MKYHFIPVLVLILLFSGCGKDEQKTSGTITLTNELYDADDYYYAMGFSFDEAKTVPTLPDQYRADIILLAGTLSGGSSVEAYLAANTYDPPFALIGEYDNSSEAESAFDDLTDVGTVTYSDLASPLEENQVWVVKTRDYNYAKIRIIEVTLDTSGDDPYATCTFEWVYQPDGSATFP